MVGRSLAELDTPAVTVDLDRLARNLERAAAYVAAHGLQLWPHLKTHKTIEIACSQRDLGAAGFTVAKSSEAEIFARAGIGPLLAHYPPVGAAKVERLVAVARQGQLTVALDSPAAAEPLATALRRSGLSAEVLIEVDVGLRRTGISPAAALRLAGEIEGLGGMLRVSGVSCYPGHLHGGPAELDAGLDRVGAVLEETIDLFARSGIDCRRVSGGSTATLYRSHRTPANELRPGNYVFLDRREAVVDYDLEDCALRVQSTVISRPVPDRVVLDAGSKTLSDAGPAPSQSGFGVAPAHPGLEVVLLHEEHAVANVPEDSSLQVGDRVELIPNHACGCVNLHDLLLGTSEGVVQSEMQVIARGAVR